MKTGTVIGIVLLAAASVAGAVLVFRGKTPPVNSDNQSSATSGTQAASQQKPADPNNPCPPLPGPGEPLPKLSLPEREFRFGKMEAFQERSHTFVLRNEGKGELVVKKGATSCKCTMSNMADKPIPPGGSVDVTLTWKPLARMDDWKQDAKLCTNDPDPKSRSITLTVKGDVVERLSIVPKDFWQLGEVFEGKPSQVSGRVYSMTLDKFKIKGVKVAGTDKIKATWKPLPEEELSPLKAKSGYLVQLDTPSSGMPAGSFAYRVKIETDVKEARDDGAEGDEVTINVEVSGSRNGPFTFLAGASDGKGVYWLADKRVLALGHLQEHTAVRRSLPIFVRNCPKEGLVFLEQSCEDCTSKVPKLSLEADKAFDGKTGISRRYRLVIDYPAGQDKNPRNEESQSVGCRVRVKTNHPEAPEFVVQLHYTPTL